MAQFSEVDRIEAAIKNKSVKELEWSLWYCGMRLGIPSARPTDIKYWSAMQERVSVVLAPPPAVKVYPAKKKKKVDRGLGLGPI